MEMILHHQNTMLAIRREMGWPAFKPANDCLCFSSGKPMDFGVGREIARIAQFLRKDVIYSGWTSTRATEPTGFTIAFREMLNVDIIDRVVPFAADEQSPIILLSTRGDEFFAVDRRGSLSRIQGKPKAIGKGRKLAMKRIKAAAAAMGGELLESNRCVPTGADWIEPTEPAEMIVTFG